MEKVSIVREHLLRPKITYISITARDDYPYYGKPDMHLFYPTLDSLNKQSMLDFEWVNMDALYHTRPDYYKDLDLNFPVKHIPAQPNFWIEHGLPSISAQTNKGIIYADGELLFFGVDGWIFPPDFMKRLWANYLKGFSSIAWYVIDFSLNKDRELLVKTPVPYDYYGYKGDNVCLDHRYDYISRVGRKSTDFWEWYFSGCASATLDATLTVNGFDQSFDGDKMLMDCDFGSRLILADKANFFLDKDLYLIRCGFDNALPFLYNIVKEVTVKCNYALTYLNRFFRRTRVNDNPVTERDINWIKNVHCPQNCKVSRECQLNHKWQFPFEHHKHPDHEYWFNLWKNNPQLIDLEEERELRLAGDLKYDRGTYIEVES